MLEDIQKEIEKMFDFLNAELFSAALDKPIFTFQIPITNRFTLGWCTAVKVWKDESNSYFEINFNPEYLDRSKYEIAETLSHEMIHLYCRKFNIKEVSRGNRYHNKKFQKFANVIGLDAEYSKDIGWGLTSVTKEFRTTVDKIEINENVFHLARNNHLSKIDSNGEEEDAAEGEEKKKSNSRKYICPNCKINVRATKEVFIKCGNCDIEMIIEDKSKEE